MDRQILGMLCIALGVSVFSVQDVIVKLMSGTYPVHEIVVLRSLVALPILVWIVKVEGARLTLRRPWVHLLRGALLYGAYTAYYLGLAQLPIATTLALYFTAPLFIAALGIPMLGERVGIGAWAAIALGFVGVLVVVRPGSSSIELACLLPISTALAYAVSALLARRLGATESGGAMALSATVVYIIGGSVTALALSGIATPETSHHSVRFLLNPWIWPKTVDLALIALCGLIAATGFFLLGQGYRLAEPNRVAPLEYVALPWGILWGYVFFGNAPDSPMILGAVIIVAAGLYTVRRKARGKPLRPA